MLAVRGEALLLGDDVEELLDIAVEIIDLLRGDEAVDLHGAVVADIELPAAAGSLDGAGGLADGVDTAKSSEPVVCGYSLVANEPNV